MATIRLMTRPHIERSGSHLDRFEARLGDDLICISRQPRLDGARELLRRGYSPHTLMVTRAEGRNYDSWRPEPLGELAKWTVREGKSAPRRGAWRPFQNTDSRCAVDASTRKSGLQGVQVPDEDLDAVGADRGSDAA